MQYQPRRFRALPGEFAISLLAAIAIMLGALGIDLFHPSPQILYQDSFKTVQAAEFPILFESIQIHDDKVMEMSYSRQGQSLLLPGGYLLFLDHHLCASATLRITRGTAFSEMTILRDRDNGIFSRFLGNCALGDEAPLYAIRGLSERYFAFQTSDPGWMLFDREKQEFLPLVIRTLANALSEIAMTEGGRVLVSYVSKDGGVYDPVDMGQWVSEDRLSGTRLVMTSATILA